MIQKRFQIFVTLLTVAVFAFSMSPITAQAQDSFPQEAEPQLSADGLALRNVPPVLIKIDHNPDMQGVKAPGPTANEALADVGAAGATLSITYIPSGGTDPYGETCATFPTAARTAFNAAAAVWANKLQSSVPITIQACWANLGNVGTLAYAAPDELWRNFTGAPMSNIWYAVALANALHGSDINTSSPDIHATVNNYYTWYTGTDGNTPAGQFDLVTVAGHEIGHGLNFAGSEDYSGGTGGYGYGTGSPNVYDTFMESGGGMAVTSYTNPSTALGTLFTSNDLWWDGPNADAANGGSRVRMYAPSPFEPGSSYSHLDLNTFSGTVNSLMVPALAAGASNHNPGPVALGMLKDMGWSLATGGGGGEAPTPKLPRGKTTDQTPKYRWSVVDGADRYQYELKKRGSGARVYLKALGAGACGANICDVTPSNTLAFSKYQWHVRARVDGVWGPWSDYKFFAVTKPIPTPMNPRGATTDKTPTFMWREVKGATQYQFTVMKGTKTLYTKTVSGGSCAATKCTNTPTDKLTYGDKYKWRARALFNGSWQQWSTYKSFKVVPQAGFWEDGSPHMNFYVTRSGTKVDNVRVYISVPSCGVSGSVVHLPTVAIANGKFSFTGPFYASGTFRSGTKANGKIGLKNFPIPNCGKVSGGPWSWTAYWQNNSQPDIQLDIQADDLTVIFDPTVTDLGTPFIVETVEP
jgi:hypothetical protein